MNNGYGYVYQVWYKKVCYRYGTFEPLDCDKCERCLKAEDLQWNEED